MKAQKDMAFSKTVKPRMRQYDDKTAHVTKLSV